MKLSAKKIGVMFIMLCMILVAFSGTISALSKKYKTTKEKTNVYLEASDSSPVIEILAKDKVLISASSRKFRKTWNYVYFKMEDSGKTKAGYVNDDSIEKIASNPRGITIQTQK